MIRGFEPLRKEVPADLGFQPVPALEVGLIAGAILLVVPRGTPWSTLTFFTPAIMGRVLPSQEAMSLPVVWAIHLGISLVYGVFVAATIVRLPRQRAILVGGLVGLVLYAANYGVVSVLYPELRGHELSALLAHIFFGLVAAGAYRALLKPKAKAVAET